jgi:hypothetical protein
MSLTALSERARLPTGREIAEIPWLARLAPVHQQLALESLRAVQADPGSTSAGSAGRRPTGSASSTACSR